VDDGQGNLRALVPPGRLVGDPLPAGGELLPVLATGPRSWVAATRPGKVVLVVWEEAPVAGASAGGGQGRLVTSAEANLGEPIVEAQFAEGRILVRTEAGSIAGLDGTTLQEGWRIRVAREDRVQALPQAGALFVMGGDELRAYDWSTGELKLQRKLAAPAVGADLRGGTLRWLDRWGGAHRADGPEATVVSTDLGLSLAAAAPAPGGFLVATAAGEVGFVEVADGAPAGSGLSGSQARGERP
jgi:hypothetical protein